MYTYEYIYICVYVYMAIPKVSLIISSDIQSLIMFVAGAVELSVVAICHFLYKHSLLDFWHNDVVDGDYIFCSNQEYCLFFLRVKMNNITNPSIYNSLNRILVYFVLFCQFFTPWILCQYFCVIAQKHR